MARIRTIKPEFFTHPEIVVLTPWARLLLLSLLCQADDEGRLYDQPMKIHANAFGGRDAADTDVLLGELVRHDRIVRYDVGGKRLIQVSNFRKHQKVNHPRDSELPPVPADFRRPEAIQGSLPEHSGSLPGNVPDDSGKPPGGLQVGMEWKGMELSTAPEAPEDDGWFETPNGWSDTQARLFSKLLQADKAAWTPLKPSAVNKLNREFGKPVVTTALGNAQDSPNITGEPYPLLRAICVRVRDEEHARSVRPLDAPEAE
jgi:hypothetical protein